MNADMAKSAFLIFRIEHIVGCGLCEDAVVFAPESPCAVVAFEAEGEDDRPAQKLSVGGPVRHVATFAAFHAHAGMFEDEGSAFIDMAFEAGFFVIESGCDERGAAAGRGCGGKSPVRVVAIGALNDAFIDAMLHRHFKLRADGGVAGIAELRLPLCEQEFRAGRLVDGMAVAANHVGFGVS